MSTKTFRFNDEDRILFDKVRLLVKQEVGVDKDVDVIRYLLIKFANNPQKILTEDKKVEKEELPSELITDISEYGANPSKYFCPNHGGKLLDMCECYENGDYIKGLKRSYGILE